MTSHSKGNHVALYGAVLLQLFLRCTGGYELQALVEAIASYDNATDVTGTMLSIFTMDNSTLLEEVAPTLLQRLLGRYPTNFLDTTHYVDTRDTRLATMVLIDATAFEDGFPAKHFRSVFKRHPCYGKRAKFVIVTSPGGFRDRSEIAVLMKRYGILNFIVVLFERERDAASPLTVWTSNQFTNREQYFRSDERPVARFFPDKLTDLHGYRFTLFGQTDFPYLIGNSDEKPYGVLVLFVDNVIQKLRNGTTAYVEDLKYNSVTDSRLHLGQDRRSFLHMLYFREPTGVHLVCPIRQKRDFLRHLLKPFSIGIWVVLGALYVICGALQRLFPAVYRYDLIGITFFGGGGVDYEQPFQFRVVTFTLTVLLFFLSEAYNTKIISLMSLSKFFVQPQTLAEMAESDFEILSLSSSLELFDELNLKFVPYEQTRREERRLGTQVYERYCVMLNLGVARIIVSSRVTGFGLALYIVREALMVDRVSLQFRQNSPFFELFQDYFNRFDDNGLWNRWMNRLMDGLDTALAEDGEDAFQEVIFFFNDLTCVWMLIVVGWLIGVVAFVGELVWFKAACKKRALKSVPKA